MKEVWLVTTGDKNAMWSEDYGMEIKGIFDNEQKARQYVEQLNEHLKRTNMLEYIEINCYTMELNKGEEI